MQFKITSQYSLCHLSVKLCTLNHYVHVQSFTSTSSTPQNYTCTLNSHHSNLLTVYCTFYCHHINEALHHHLITIKYPTLPSFLLLDAHNKIITLYNVMYTRHYHHIYNHDQSELRKLSQYCAIEFISCD